MAAAETKPLKLESDESVTEVTPGALLCERKTRNGSARLRVGEGAHTIWPGVRSAGPRQIPDS